MPASGALPDRIPAYEMHGEARHQQPVRSRDLLELRDITWLAGQGGLVVSPDREYIAFQLRQASSATNSYELAWYVVPVAGGRAAERVADGGEPLLHVYPHTGYPSGLIAPNRARWSPDGEWLAYLARKHGETQVWRTRRDGSAHQQLTHHGADVEDFVWHAAGTRLIFQVGARRDARAEATQLRYDSGVLVDRAFWPTARRPWEAALPRDKLETWVVEVGGTLERPATEEELEQFEALVGRERRLEALAAASEEKKKVEWSEPARGANRDARLVVTSSALTPHVCAHPACSKGIEEVWWSENATEVLFLRSGGAGSLSLHAWDPERRTVRAILQTDELLFNCSSAGNAAICLHEAPTKPRRIVAVDLLSGAVRPLVDPNPEMARKAYGAVRKLEWQSASGIRTYGHLVLPPGHAPGTRHPLVVVSYRSRGFLRGGSGDEYPVHVMAALGLAVLSLERPSDLELGLPTHDADERDRRAWQDVYRSRMTHEALLAGLDLLVREGLVDKDCIAITGVSGGAEIAAYALIHSDLFATAAAASLGFSSLAYFLVSHEYRARFDVRGLGMPSSAEDINWDQVSIARNADRIHAPLLVQASDHEFLYDMEALTVLTEAGRPVELYVFPDEFHIKLQPRHRQQVYERNVDWLQFWLQGIEDASADKRVQYKRWRAMRDRLTDLPGCRRR
jgi:dipeptidyl aminopeptidase/acylaminoacyl peptidase